MCLELSSYSQRQVTKALIKQEAYTLNADASLSPSGEKHCGMRFFLSSAF